MLQKHNTLDLMKRKLGLWWQKIMSQIMNRDNTHIPILFLQMCTVTRTTDRHTITVYRFKRRSMPTFVILQLLVVMLSHFTMVDRDDVDRWQQHLTSMFNQVSVWFIICWCVTKCLYFSCKKNRLARGKGLHPDQDVIFRMNCFVN